MEDMMLEANEIQEVMSRSYGINDDIDEAELEAEFDALGNYYSYKPIIAPPIIAPLFERALYNFFASDFLNHRGH